MKIKLLSDRNRNKTLQLFCAIPVAIVFFIYLYLLCDDNFLYFPYMTTK